MDKKKQEEKQDLVDAVIEELKRDTTNTALWGNISSLLYYSVGIGRLKTFLPKKQVHATEKGEVGPAMGAEAQAAFERMTAYEEHSQYQQQPMTEEELIAKLNAEGEG